MMVRKSEAFMESIRIIWHISFQEFCRWMRHSRLIILGVMLVFIHIQVIKPLKECAQLMESRLSFAEPFTVLGNSSILCLMIPLLFLALIAEFPQKDGIDLFYQIRCSKRIWICGQTLFAVGAGIFLVLFLALSSGLMLWDSGEWRLEFSYAVTHFTTVYSERSWDYVTRLLSEKLYQQMTLAEALFHTVSLMFLYFWLLSMILLLSAICGRKYIGIPIDSFLIILGTKTTAAGTSLMWLFPMAHSLPIVHYREYLSEPVFPIGASYLYLAGGGIALFLCCMARAKWYQAGKGN